MKEKVFVEVEEGWKQDILPGYEDLVSRNKHLRLETSETKRPVSSGAERHLGEIFPVLDHGFVYLVDYMGNDQAVEQAARVSYGKGTRKTSETRGLIRYLERHEHTTPFEMVEFKFHAKMPIFVARQWVRHRTASINEYSARYSILDNEFYVPDPEVISYQSSSNKQGRGDAIDPKDAEFVRNLIIADAARNYDHYETMIDDYNIARELARINLSLDFYTQWYWKIDLHNALHFLRLRKDPHAQWEIRQYADVMGKIVDDAVPLAWEAFVDYQLDAVKFSKQEKETLTRLILEHGGFTEEEMVDVLKSVGMSGKGERTETLDKLTKMGLIHK